MSYSAAVITISDKGARGARVDTSGPALCDILAGAGWDVVYREIVPDEQDAIKAQLIHCADALGVVLALTTGGTGFSARDVTPEATKAVIERETPGIAEAMRMSSMKVTPRGCLSRAVAGIRGQTLIVNLPGSEKAARENLLAVLPALAHGGDMLRSAGSADCAAPEPLKGAAPSMDAWLREAKRDRDASACGMYLFHTGVVRRTAKAAVRGHEDTPPVEAMRFSSDPGQVAAALARARAMPGIHYARAWLNEGTLSIGDDIMRVLVGGDIRPHVVDALQALVEEIKTNCVREIEIY